MYPDQIKNYTTKQQFEEHKKMLKDLAQYYSNRVSESNPALRNIQKEKWLLEKHYQKWKKSQVSKVG
ncbi:hypothetical protein [Enterococcus sp. AZ109]|uniref:hypothetical protein n=1 Tax=Enterococcus sp. AZ109 TaxID=2774634 RepID=UPI003F2754BB